MRHRGKVHHWSAYVFGELGSQELDDFGEAIRSPCITSAEVGQLVEAMAERARSYFGDVDNGELAALGMRDGADAELAVHHERARRARRGAGRSAGLTGDDAVSSAPSSALLGA